MDKGGWYCSKCGTVIRSLPAGMVVCQRCGSIGMTGYNDSKDLLQTIVRLTRAATVARDSADLELKNMWNETHMYVTRMLRAYDFAPMHQHDCYLNASCPISIAIGDYESATATAVRNPQADTEQGGV